MISPDDLLDLAKHQLGDQEPGNRSAISRAYYACYHSTRNAAIKNLGYFDYKGTSSHKHLCTYLINYDDKKVNAIGVYLQQLKHKRVDADYTLRKTINKNNAILVVAMASSMIDEVKSIPNHLDGSAKESIK